MARTNAVVRKATVGLPATVAQPVGVSAAANVGAIDRVARSVRIPTAVIATAGVGTTVGQGTGSSPIWSGPPDHQFIQGTASNWDVSQYDTKGATDAITVAAGPAITGITYDGVNKRFVYDGAGAVHTEASAAHQLLANDAPSGSGVGTATGVSATAAVGSPATSPAGTSNDWTTRSTAPGVVLALPLATSGELSTYLFGGAEAVPPSLDTSIRPTGQAGSIKFTSSPSDSTQSGTLKIPYGRKFVEGDTYWVSIRQYMPPEWAYMMHPVTSTGQVQGMKQIILSAINNSHTANEIVLENSIQHGLVIGYNDSADGFRDWIVTVGSDLIFQGAIDNAGGNVSPDSVYANVNGGTDPDTGLAFNSDQISWARYGGSYNSARDDTAFGYGLGHPLSGGVRYPINQWATFTIRVTIGTWGVYNSHVTVWVAPEGGAYTKIVDNTGVRLDNDVDGGQNCSWPMAYYTARTSNVGRTISSRSNSSLAACTAIRCVGLGSTVGAGTLRYTASTKRFTWQDSGGSQGTARGVASWKRFVNVASGGSSSHDYDNGKFLGIEITNFAALPVTDQVDTVTISGSRGTQTTNVAEFIVSTQAIKAAGGFSPS